MCFGAVRIACILMESVYTILIFDAVPMEIDKESIEYWGDIAKNTWKIKEKKQLADFLENNKFHDWVDWSALAEHLPNVYYPSESEHHTDSETSRKDASRCKSVTSTSHAAWLAFICRFSRN